MKKIKTALRILPVIVLFLLFSQSAYTQSDATCDEREFVFADDFSTVQWKDPGSSVNWPGNGEITLNWLGANFQVAQPAGMGARIYVSDSGDFDGDGLPDLVGLDISGVPRLLLIRNQFTDTDGDGYDDDNIIFFIDPLEVYDTELYSSGSHSGPAAITVGDYNDDGLLDFLFIKNNADSFSDNEFFACMYINTGTPTDPQFFPHYSPPNLVFTSRFLIEGIYVNWAGDHMCTTDIDKDDDLDVLIISEDKVFLVRNPGSNEFELDRFEIAELDYDQRTGYTSGVGGSSVDAGDFDQDGDIDVICGTAEDYSYIVYYENNGFEFFTRKDIFIPAPEATGPVAMDAADFNQDGFMDIFGATDKWRAGHDARMWIYKSKGITGEGENRTLELQFYCMLNCMPILPDPHDVDMSTVLDYDGDGDMDIIVADANHSGDYYLVINELAPVYTLHGEARSKVVTPDLDPNAEAITRVRLESLDQWVRGGSSDGLNVALYVSNNGGRDWEFLEEFNSDEITDVGPRPWHYFVHFGSRLKWKAVLTAPEDDMEEYDLASFETPVLSRIELRYVVVDRREYSRSSVAVQVVDDANQLLKLIIGGSFYFPGWQGHLRAYDVTDMELINSSHSELQTITRPDFSEPSGREIVAENVNIRWDAGELLDDRSSGSRTIYSALPDNSGQLQRVDFTADNTDHLAPYLNDFQNDNSGLIEFVRGEGRDWKLGDINHSNPVIVGPPSGDPALKGSGYETFAQTWENRDKALVVGANDGMLHCFNVLTGEEMWAFIPYNLVPKLRNMWPVDQATQERYFARDVYVDSSPVVEDVYINDEWKTVLICGQGRGQGSGRTADATGNFYFALDITDINNPQVLWEFTDPAMGETWSVPVIGKITKEGQDSWAAFMGSGYDNVPGQGIQGNRFYAVDIANGTAFWTFDSEPEVDTSAVWANGENVAVALPGSPSSIDVDEDGFTDRVYIADLEGRLWKIDAAADFIPASPWAEETLYEDSRNYPIITKPEAWRDPASISAKPRIYFGTGGDDKAPDAAEYSFIALIDGDTPEVEWYLGDPNILNLPAEKQTGSFSTGEKVWADPKIANYIVYFSTLTGNIETVDPCSNLAGIGRLYARFIKPIAGSSLGATAFKSAAGPMENMTLEIKTRAAVTLGESGRAGGVRKREVYIQEYDSTIQKLEQPAGALLKIKSWREIFKIIK
jgi:hypothetical protein